MEGPSQRASLRRTLASHAAACILGIAAAVVLCWRMFETSARFGDYFAEIPLSNATEFAYAWGNDSDATALLTEYASSLRSRPGFVPLARPKELALTEFRRAIVERRTHEELLALCRATAECKLEKLDVLVARLAAERKATRAP